MRRRIMATQAFLELLQGRARERSRDGITAAGNCWPVVTGNPRKRKLAFSSMSKRKASALASRLRQLADMDACGLVLLGGWRNRRFVIVAGRAAGEHVGILSCDVVALTLTLPTEADADAIVRQFRQFGGQVERAFRERCRGEFETVPASEGGPRHIVHRYHHVALCGCRGPWPDHSSPALFESDGDECAECRAISRTKPSHATRFHPLSFDKASIAQGLTRDRPCAGEDSEHERAARTRHAIQTAGKR
jgi:hypothetical protein